MSWTNPFYTEVVPSPLFPAEEFRRLVGPHLSDALPVEQGGRGLGIDPEQALSLLLLLKEMGRGNLAVGRLFEGHVNALLLIHQFGSPQQIQRAAEDVIEHQRVFGVWNTGPHGLPMVTETPEGRYRFLGGKTFASGAGSIQRAIVTGEIPGRGWQMFAMPLSELQFQIDYDSWHPMGMEASDSFTVDFSGVELPVCSLLGEPSDYFREPGFTGGAFRFASVHLGGAEALFDLCREFILTSGRQEDPHQLYRLGRMATLVQSGRQWIEQAARWLQAGETTPARAHMMRVASEEICTAVMNLVEVSVGARGLVGWKPIGQFLRDLQVYLRQAGADAAVTSIGREALHV